MALLIIALLAIVVLPYGWVRYTIDRHSREREDLPGTGGELARHLLNRFDLPHVQLEETDLGDHYDPQAKTVRLSKKHMHGRSLSAVAVAAHEVSHALQDAGGERMLAWRQRLATFAMATDKIASVVFLIAPVAGLIFRTPAAFMAFISLGIALLAVRVIVNLITLPVEFDASFGKALPILKDGKYLNEKDLKPVKTVLRAAALTYVTSALIALVNLWTWIRALR